MNPSLRLVALLLLMAAAPNALSQSISPHLYEELRWRMIGPFRGGRTVAATGVPSQPNLFYVGACNGGVWKTADFGHTWSPILDGQPTGSVGSIAVALSNPNVIYVGSGEGIQRPDLSTGDGVYKSTDGGKTWRNTGLRDGQQIPAIVIDPKNPDRLFVAVLGHPYGANVERGVFRSTNGGTSWQKVLYKDENTGAAALALDPGNSQIIYASLWSARQGPWENGAWQGNSGLFKSIDGGDTWKQLTNGLPSADDGLGRIGICIAPSDPQCLYVRVDSRRRGGVYRTDDAGESWRLVNSETRVWGRGDDFTGIAIDPKNKDTLYVTNTSTYRSTDGGKTFAAIKGAPGGDDYQSVWINRDNPQIILLSSDQGAIISVNGGQTWSSWYNQPTAQFYHVITDNQFPYWVYGGQQESGSAGVASRGPLGQITFRDWNPVGVEEYGYVAPDPLNPNIIYGGKASRFDKTTGQVQPVGPEVLRSGKYRFLRTAPLLFSTADPHVLFLGANVLFKTTNGGHSWDIVSPDLSREKPDIPESIGIFRSQLDTPNRAKGGASGVNRRGVIYTVAPSHKDINVIWCGTDDGLIHVTQDGGKTWADVTPTDVTPWSKISIIDGGRFDANTAYAAVNRLRLDDQRPHIYRTHDGGKTWTHITTGLLDNAPVNTVREDPVRPGLLFAGTERAVHVSFDDGDHWQTLRLNMPATSIRDLVIHDDDIVVGTHGRSFWILDNITPLRQLRPESMAEDAILFRPQLAYRVRNNVNTDTPLPPEEPAGQNPPEGAMIDYVLKTDATGPVALEILDSAGKVVRRFSGTDILEPIDEKKLDIPTYWARPSRTLSAKAGMHRFVWDLHYPPAESGGPSFGMAAIIRDTPAGPFGPWAHPGQYTVRLTANGKVMTQPLTVKMDPRVKTSPADLDQQFQISMRCYEGIKSARSGRDEIVRLRARLKGASERAGAGELADAISEFDRKVAALEGTSGPRRRRGAPASGATPDLARIVGDLSAVLSTAQDADARPTVALVESADRATKTLADLLSRWNSLRTTELKLLNDKLRQANHQPIAVDSN